MSSLPASAAPSFGPHVTLLPPGSRVVHVTHSMIVKGVSLTKGIGSGNSLTSAAFLAGGYKWLVLLYPEGENPEDEYVSAYVVLASDDINVRALFSIELYDMSGKGNHMHFCPWNRDNANPSSKHALFNFKGVKWGYRRIFKRDELEGSDYVRDDYLRLDCSIGVGQYDSSSERIPMSRIPSPNFKTYLPLLHNKEPKDITFRVDGIRVMSHKKVIMERCPKFAAEFIGAGLEDAYGDIPIENVHQKVFAAFMYYLYSDSIVSVPLMLETTVPSSTSARHWVATKLLAEAARYELPRLRLLCESFLSKQLSVSTHSDIHSEAISCEASSLQRVCSNFHVDVLKMMSFRNAEYKKMWWSRDNILPDGPNSEWIQFPERKATRSRCSVRLVWGPLSEDYSYHSLFIPIRNLD